MPAYADDIFFFDAAAHHTKGAWLGDERFYETF